MSDSDFVIFVQKSDKCKKLLELIDEKLSMYNKRGIRVFIKKVTEDTIPADITKLPTCNVRGVKAEGTSAIISALDKLCKPKQVRDQYDELEEYNRKLMGTKDDYERDEADAEDDLDEGEMTKSEIDKRMAEYARRAPKHRRNSDNNDINNEPEPEAEQPKPKRNHNRRAEKTRVPDSDDDSEDESDDGNYIEPDDNLHPDAGLDIDHEMMTILNS